MKVRFQWALKDAQPWQEIDSSLWATLPNKGVPRSGQLGGQNNQPGWLRNVSVQGITAEGFDHVAIEPVVIGLDEGVRYTLWNDDPDDYPPGERQAIVWTILPLAPDPQLGMAINTRQSCVRYCEGPRYAMLEPSPPLNTTVRPWAEFVPPADAVTRHGIWLDDAKLAQHVAVAPHGHWSWMHWADHLPDVEVELDALGRRILKEQRKQGRYRQAQHTITYYQRDTDRAVGWGAYTHEDALETTTGTSATETVTTNANGVQSWCFTTDTNQPNSADWPTGIFHAQLNCTAASGGLTYGLNTVPATDEAIVRVDSTAASIVESIIVSGGSGDFNDFSGTGLKLATSTNWNSTAGDAGERFAIGVYATGDSHGDAITLTLNTTDSYADGPWTGGVSGTVAVTEADDTSSASGTVNNRGTTAATEADDTMSASGLTPATGTVAVTEADDTSSASGTVTVTGTAAVTEADDTSSASGTVQHAATVAAIEADDTSSASATVTVSGSLAKTEGADSSTASGLVTVTGTLSRTEGADTSAASGLVTVTGTLGKTEGVDSSTASGTVSAGAATGTLAVTEADDISAASGNVIIFGTVSRTNQDDQAAASGTVGVVASAEYVVIARRRAKR